MTTLAIGSSGSGTPALGGFAFDTALARAGSTGRLQDSQRQFADVMSIAERRPGAAAPTEEAAREAAENFVALTLVQPVLDLVRETSEAAEPFKPTQAEQQFGGLLDARIASDLVKSARFPLVDRLARDLLKNAGEPSPEATS